ncbi:hypothetical protein RT99_08060 [Flavobacterium sp. MEB061]|uniref:hypothetical protein n=1 Tax=Flavobacterium sp. MEB061 TaxID=1587524 RepID=UPI0005AC509F|nr:hypothetical protein [Flavobacterium sp. MEB061]KIQ22143.1 hypothetical protein RT99_08060 [Flavobacterium sp. MEB061]
MKNTFKLYLTLWVMLFTFLNVNAQCETIKNFFKNDMYTSKELVAFAEKDPQKAYDSWKILYNEKAGLTRSVEELNLVSKNLDEITKVGYSTWKKAGSLSEDIINQVNDALGKFYSKSNDKILTDIIEEAVYADNYTKLSKSFGIDKTLKGKTLGSSGKRYELTASNIYKGEELGKFPAYENIKYLNESERQLYKVAVKDGELFVNGSKLASLPTKRVIFVMDEGGNIYAGVQKIGEFHHSSFLSGADVVTAGEFKFIDNILEISPSSGHYTPTAESLTGLIEELISRGVNINNLKINRIY